MSISLHIKDKSENSRFLKAASFRKNTRKTEPHKHNSYFEIIYLSEGRGFHAIDNRKYEVTPPVLFFIRHEQVHYWALDDDLEPDGYVLILKRSFFEKSLDGELKHLLAKISKLSCAYLEDDITIRQLFELIVKENAKEAEINFSFTEGLLKGLFVKILQMGRSVIERSTHQAELYRAFIELLIQEHPIRNRVAHYAGLLNTTPQNLNTICRKATDRSAGNVLAEYIVDEAKRLLVYTDHSISEISFALSFRDPSHFVKYFKRHTSHTPQGFRAIQR